MAGSNWRERMMEGLICTCGGGGGCAHALDVMAAAGTVLVIGGWVMAIALAVGVNFSPAGTKWESNKN